MRGGWRSSGDAGPFQEWPLGCSHGFCFTRWRRLLIVWLHKSCTATDPGRSCWRCCRANSWLSSLPPPSLLIAGFIFASLVPLWTIHSSHRSKCTKNPKSPMASVAAGTCARRRIDSGRRGLSTEQVICLAEMLVPKSAISTKRGSRNEIFFAERRRRFLAGGRFPAAKRRPFLCGAVAGWQPSSC